MSDSSDGEGEGEAFEPFFRVLVHNSDFCIEYSSS